VSFSTLGIVLTSGTVEVLGTVASAVGAVVFVVCVVLSTVSLSILRPHPNKRHTDSSKQTAVAANFFIISLLLLIA
jgi:hypothetical protein